MSEDMRGLFFVIKGQHNNKKEPSYTNKVTGDKHYIGGYDPNDKETQEWYMLLDKKTFHCVACGTDLNKVLRGVYTQIKKYKGVAKKYFKYVSEITSDDYYEVTYLGHRPLTPEQRVKKAEGKCPRVSPIMRDMYEHIYEEYGDFFDDLIRPMEDLAYSEMVEEKPFNKTRKLVSKNKTKDKVVMETPTDEVIETPATPKKVKPKVKMGIKKLSM